MTFELGMTKGERPLVFYKALVVVLRRLLRMSDYSLLPFLRYEEHAGCACVIQGLYYLISFNPCNVWLHSPDCDDCDISGWPFGMEVRYMERLTYLC